MVLFIHLLWPDQMYTVCLIFWYLSSVNSCLVSSINGLRIVFLSGTAFWLSVFWVRGIQDGHSFGGLCTVTRLPNFRGLIDFLTQGAPLRKLRARESSATTDLMLLHVVLHLNHFSLSSSSDVYAS